MSKKFADGTFGILASIAYNKRRTSDVGYSAVNILPTYINGGLCSPVGFAPQNPANNAAKGVDALNCSTGNPRTSDLAAYNTIYNSRNPLAPNTPGSGTFLPRLPRYVFSQQDAERLGATLTLQWKPDENTEMSLDGLYSRFKVERRDNYIAGLSFGRNLTNNGQPMVSVRDISLTPQGSLIYGLFDGVDVRSEGLVDRYTTDFKQLNYSFMHRFSDSFVIDGLAGYSRSGFKNPQRLTVSIDAIDARGFSVDFRNNPNIPTITYGFDISNPANFQYAPALADGTVRGVFSNSKLDRRTINQTYELNATWNVTPDFAFKVGGQYRSSDYASVSQNVVPTQTATQALPAGTTLASITRQITGLDALIGSGAPASWVAIDQDKWKNAVGFDSFQYCGIECGVGSSYVVEKVTSGYLMATFDTKDMLPIPIRGDAGVRYVHTNQFSRGYVPVAAAAGAPFPTTSTEAQVSRSYNDWLPSVNLVAELTPKLWLRLSAAKVMSRAELGSLVPSGSINATIRTASSGNPYLEPIRATTKDAALEWYFAPGQLLSVAYFHKSISSYIQTVTSLIPYAQTGFPNSLLVGTTSSPTDDFTVSRVTNTPGGPLKGVEVNGQFRLTFLPGFLRNVGILANYTHVESKINYILASANGIPTQTITANLINLSPNTASGTVYYEDSRFSIRGTVSYRSAYLRAVPSGANDSDVLGNRSTVFVDASASYNLSDKVKIIVEAQNLTAERNKLYIDSGRQDTLYNTRIGRTISVGATVKM